jgi:hypothetical protein
MAIESTWELISKNTVSATTSEFSVTGIPSTYTDLYVIGMWDTSEGANGMRIAFNNNRNTTYMQQSWNSSTTQSMSQLDSVWQTWATNGGTTFGKQFSVWHFMNYSVNSSKKTAIWNGINYDVNGIDFNVGVQSDQTSAISSIQFRNTGGASSNQLVNPATFYIYGIKAA